ncbi:hypothetical protein CTAYLR_000181 [Chrysophaeum taylorii]|uniref:Uncharacterized protein n=1 Tax=Chrysophaeum taylorii TaxID=2483200 RepID=A0AAD7UGU3_9STRA|nr:hypothetical protein CTAYLR_000181 [Chrysophaeum taylorii]
MLSEQEQHQQIERHRELMRQRKRERDRLRRRLETIETRKKVLSGELSVHPEAVRARKRRIARWGKGKEEEQPAKHAKKNPEEANVASILVGLLSDLNKQKEKVAQPSRTQDAAPLERASVMFA